MNKRQAKKLRKKLEQKRIEKLLNYKNEVCELADQMMIQYRKGVKVLVESTTRMKDQLIETARRYLNNEL